MFGSPNDTNTLIFQNPINLGSNTGTISVTSGGASIDAQLAAGISGSGGLVINGNGVLQLAASNGYLGGTTVNGGILQLANSASLPGGTGATGGLGNLTMNGGIIDLDSTDFKMALGTGSGQVQLSNVAGFSASGGTRVLNFGGGTAQVTWGAGSFFNGGGTLAVGSNIATGTLAFQNPISLSQQSVNIAMFGGAATIDGQFTGVINGTGGVNITGNGAIEFTASNTYTGATVVGGGVLRLSNSGAIPGGLATTGGLSNLVFNGGVIELNAMNFTRGLGTAANQVQFLGSGGFSGYNPTGTGSSIVNIGGGSAGMAWGATSFVPSGQSLILGANTGNMTVVFQNPISIASYAGSIVTQNGSALVDAQLTGAISGSNGMTFGGNGTLELTTTNTYAGATTLAGGVLRLSSSFAFPGGIATTGGSGNLNIAGGVVELNSSNFTRGLGTGASNVQFSSSGGFSAYNPSGTGSRFVNLGGGSATVNWGATSFIPVGQSLILGSPSDNIMVDFQNPINTSPGTAMINVTDGSALVDARLSGVISGTGGLTVAGSGTLELTNTNTYTGTTLLTGGVLRLSSSNALPGGISNTGGLSNLVLSGGVIELNANSFSRGLGISVTQLQFTSGGGGLSVGRVAQRQSRRGRGHGDLG